MHKETRKEKKKNQKTTKTTKITAIILCERGWLNRISKNWTSDKTC